MNHIAARLGFVGRPRERSLLFIGDTEDAFDGLLPLLDEIRSRDHRLRILLSSADPEVRKWLHHRFPGLLVIPLSYGNQVSAEMYLRQLKIRAVAFIETAGLGVAAPFIAKLQQLAIGVVTVSGRGVETLPEISAKNHSCKLVVVLKHAPRREDLDEGIASMTAAELADKFDVMMARDLKALRKPGTVTSLLLPHRWRWVVSRRTTRLASLNDLKLHLGAPKTILCLGNGPSSADAALLQVRHDALFRVNHSWLTRKYMAEPDVVFTGGRPTLRTLDRVVFGLQSAEAEDRLVQTRAFNPLRSHSTYFNVNDVSDALQRFQWGHLRPTNGASMIAAAIALQPKTLVVAGIDLFQHAEGTYPGESSIANAYAPAHSRETELEFLLQLFAGYEGEIVIFGDILRSAWEEHRLKPS